MKVYHTSNTIVTCPDTTHSREYLDFGKGFYVTTFREQAVKYGARFRIRGEQPILNTYEMEIDHKLIKYKRFEQYDEDWLDFVAANRDGKIVEQYDIIEGGVANDKVFDTIDLYFAGRMSKSDALQKLAYLHPNVQICFHTEAAIQLLRFIESEIIE